MRKRNKGELQVLPTLPNINEEIFNLAGITLQDRADMLRSVFDRTKKRMRATTVKVFQSEGEILYSKALTDHGTQGKAIDQALVLVDLHKSDAPRVTIKANVVLPDWALGLDRNVVDVTPKVTPNSPKPTPSIMPHKSNK